MFFDSENNLRDIYLTQDERDLLQILHKPVHK